MNHTFGQTAHISAEVFDDYNIIVKRCLLSELLNEAFEKMFGDLFNDQTLVKALEMLKASKISARQHRGSINFAPLASGRVNGKSAVFEIFDYSPPDHLNKWFYGRATTDAAVYEGKFFIRSSAHSVSCRVVGGISE